MIFISFNKKKSIIEPCSESVQESRHYSLSSDQICYPSLYALFVKEILLFETSSQNCYHLYSCGKY